MIRYVKQTSREAVSPPRPCFLPISEPIPVPSQRSIAQPSSPSTNIRSGSSVPRSQPISMKRSVDTHRSHAPDIGSLSPPSVQFVIGTPPSRRYKQYKLSIHINYFIYMIHNIMMVFNFIV